MKTSIMDLTTTIKLQQGTSGNWIATATALTGKGTIKVTVSDGTRRLAVKRARASVTRQLLQGGSK
jgi:hypothetical protein